MFSNNSDYENQSFKQINADKAHYKGLYFSDCHFEDCQFLETLFEQCQFHDCVFKNCDFSLTNWTGSSFQNGRFYSSKLIGINWTLLSWSKFVKESPLSFEQCVLDYGTFIGLTIQKQKMSSCSLKEVDFTEADLTEAKFIDSELARAHFRHSKLAKANFQKASSYHIDPKINDITKARFDLPEAINLLRSMDIVLLD